MIYETINCAIDENRKCEFKAFKSIQEFIDYSTDEHINSRNNDYYNDWVGRKMGNANHARKLANEVWEEGLRLFDDAKSKLSSRMLPTPKTRRRRARFDEFNGDEVCVDRLRAGAPFWRTTSRDMTSGPTTLTIAVHTTAPAVLSSEDLNWRGVVSAVLCELLETAGYRVKIVLYDYGRQVYKDDFSALTTLTVKEFDEPLDSAGLIAATSGWMFRVWGLGAVKRSARGIGHNEGCGFCCELSSDQFYKITGDKPHAMIQGVFDCASAIELIESTMAKLESGALVAG